MSENQKSWLWRHCRRRAIYWLLRSPLQIVTLNPKTKSTGAFGRYQLLSCWCGCLPQAAWPGKTFSESQDAVGIAQIAERGAYPWLIVVMIHSQQSTVAANIWASLPGYAGYGQFEHKADSLIAKFKEGDGMVSRDWCMSRVTADYLRLVICIIVCLSWAGLINNVITPLMAKPSATKLPENWSCERGNYWHADASAWCCCAWCKIHEGVSRC